MQLFGRPLRSYARAIARLPSAVSELARTFLLFREPVRYLRNYVLQSSPPENTVRFRDGLRLSLSSHPGDLVTTFVVFARRDYGQMPVGGTVVDVGANIGCFSLYAARAGARRVIALEPCNESYRKLAENIAQNGYGEVIQAFELAVTNRAGMMIQFPTRSSPENRIGRAQQAGALQAVRTTTIEEILAAHSLESIDLLKLDCEGAEYDIVLGAPDAMWSRVRQIRLEYHDGRSAELIEYFRRRGYAVTRHRSRSVDGSDQGDIWLDRQ